MLPKQGLMPHRRGIRGLMPHTDDRYPINRPIYPFWDDVAEKVIFLNKDNLDELEGYKATVILKSSNEVHIILTGFNEKGSKRLYDSLKKMKKEEIYGDNL